MKKAFCIVVAVSIAAAAFCEEKPASRLARTRELVARHSASTATVLVHFNEPEDEDDDGFSLPYMCPNCNSIHRRGVSEYVKEERPMDMAGYVVAPDRVMVQDLMIKSNLVASVEVEFAGRRYAAKPVRRFPGRGAVELKTEKPIDGAKPIEFRAKGSVPLAEAKFFFLVKENGQMVSGVAQPCALLHHGLHEFPDPVVLFQVAVNIGLGLRPADSQILCQGEFGDPVDDAEVHGLGAASHLGGDLLQWGPEDLGGGDPVDVLSGVEGGLHGLVVRHVGNWGYMYKSDDSSGNRC